LVGVLGIDVAVGSLGVSVGCNVRGAVGIGVRVADEREVGLGVRVGPAAEATVEVGESSGIGLGLARATIDAVAADCRPDGGAAVRLDALAPGAPTAEAGGTSSTASTSGPAGVLAAGDVQALSSTARASKAHFWAASLAEAANLIGYRIIA
jgi:hypothetical protein